MTTSGRSLGRRGGLRYWLALVLSVLVLLMWATEVWLIQRDGRGADGVEGLLHVVAPVGFGLALLAFWIVWTVGPRARRFTVMPHALILRRFRKTYEIPWDRISHVTPLRHQRGEFSSRIYWDYGHPWSFTVRGVLSDGQSVHEPVTARSYSVRRLRRMQAALLEELAGRFGELTHDDAFNAEFDNPGSPGAEHAQTDRQGRIAELREMAIEDGAPVDHPAYQPDVRDLGW